MTGNNNNFIQKLYLAFTLLLLLMVFGTAGFMLIEDYDLIEALYMTIIVISTVGLSSVSEISQETKLFIAVLIIISVGLTTYGLSVVARYVMEGELRHYLKYRKVKKRIVSLKDHVIICGYGRNGQQACVQLAHYKKPFVVIEKDEKLIEKIERDQNILFVEGDATNDDVLAEAGIGTAESLITTLPDDSQNVYVVLTAKGINHDLHIISRASHDRAYLKLKRAGANNVIMPDKIGGTHMASLIVKPDVIEFIDVILGKSDENIEEVNFANNGKKFIGKTIGDIQLQQRSGVNIIGLKKQDGSYQLNPDDHVEITDTTKIFILGCSEEIESALKHLNG